MKLTCVVPCYNELANLEHGVLDEMLSFLEQLRESWELIVVDDASTDGSDAFVADWMRTKPAEQFRHLTIPHGGKPAAVWAGIEAARGELVLFTDMDQSTPLGEWAKLRPYYDLGFDVVIGSRGGDRDGFQLLRQVGSSVFRNLRRAVVLREIRDTQCGFKSCRREAALRCFPKLAVLQASRPAEGWTVTAYDVELLYLFQRAGYRIAEVDVQWSNRDRSETKSQPGNARALYFRESQLMLQELVKVCVNRARGAYDDLD